MSRRRQFAEPGEPLSPTAFYILLSLRSQERHGYDILKKVRDASAGKINLGPGTLYTTLKRLLEAGVVVEVGDRPTADQGDPRRRYYRLSDRGHRDLAAELRRMERALVLARGVQLEPRG